MVTVCLNHLNSSGTWFICEGGERAPPSSWYCANNVNSSDEANEQCLECYLEKMLDSRQLSLRRIKMFHLLEESLILEVNNKGGLKGNDEMFDERRDKLAQVLLNVTLRRLKQISEGADSNKFDMSFSFREPALKRKEVETEIIGGLVELLFKIASNKFLASQFHHIVYFVSTYNNILIILQSKVGEQLQSTCSKHVLV